MKITHQCLRVKGIDFLRLQNMTIHHRPNHFAFMQLIGEADAAVMEPFMTKSEETLITVCVIDLQGEETVIFRGYILKFHLREKKHYSQVKILLADASYRLDLQKERKSFQNLQKNYGVIVSEACQQNGLGDKVQVIMKVPDKPIGEFILQLDETDWAFARRMASHFGVPVFTDCLAEHPVLFIGLPQKEGKESVLDRAEYSICYRDGKRQFWQENALADKRQSMAEDFVCRFVESDEYLPLGAKVSFEGKSYYIAAVTGKLRDGMLHMRYRLAGRESFMVSLMKNSSCAGLVLIGQVKEVQQDKVKVHFVHVDAEYDEGTTKWFPYSTSYSSSDGSGWYVMPSEGDYVRVFFPTQEEKDAFCVSTVNAAPPANTRNKTLRAPGGKELLLTDDSVHLITKHQDTFIDMSGTGIHVSTSNAIKVRADKKVILRGKEIEFLAEKKIKLMAGGTAAIMTHGEIQLAAKDILVGGI